MGKEEGIGFDIKLTITNMFIKRQGFYRFTPLCKSINAKFFDRLQIATPEFIIEPNLSFL